MNSEFQSLPPETQEAVKRTMDTMEPAQTPAEIRETLEGTQKGGVKNSIRNCLTVFQRDPLFRGALRLNLLTEQIDIVKPLGWERTSTTLTDMDMNYLLLYLEENYGLTSEKKVQSAINCCQRKPLPSSQGLSEQSAMGRHRAHPLCPASLSGSRYGRIHL